MLPSEAHPAIQVTPFAGHEYVDVNRCCKILGVSRQTIIRLAHSHMLLMIAYRTLSWKKINYQSIVTFCDYLREEYKIASRRPALSAPGLRHRDEDLLPFPLNDTIGADHAYKALGVFRHQLLIELIQEGRFEAYRIVPGAPWRISASSLEIYIAAQKQGARGPKAYVVPMDDCGL
jgi:hypothetical protein